MRRAALVEERLVAAAVSAGVPDGVRWLEVAQRVVFAIHTLRVGLVKNQIAVVLHHQLAAVGVHVGVRRPLHRVVAPL